MKKLITYKFVGLCLVSLFILSGCAHKSTVLSVQATNIYSDNENKILGQTKYIVDQSSLGKLKRDDTVQGMACAAHKYPVDASQAFVASLPSMLEQVFESVSKSESVISNSELNLLFRVERFEPRLKFNQKLFSMDAEATVEIGLSVVGSRDGARVFGTTVESQRTRSSEAGAFCEGGGQALSDATRDAIKDVLEKIGERMANSQKLNSKASTNSKNETRTNNKEEISNSEKREVSKLYSPLNPSAIKITASKDAVAIVIGISNYKKLPKADYANEDARNFAVYANKALGIKQENIKTLIDSEADDAEIIKAFKNWLPLQVNPEKTDVYVFFSGHGLPSQDGKNLFLLPYGADRDLLERTAINQNELIKILADLKPKSMMLITDSCYSGMSKTGDTLIANARPIVLKTKEIVLPKNFTLFSASSPDQISSSSKDLRHGVFSYYLMKGLEGDADLNSDNKITLAELHSYARINVGKMALSMNRMQEPQLIGDGGRVIANVNR
jgi:hypothetical protein